LRLNISSSLVLVGRGDGLPISEGVFAGSGLSGKKLGSIVVAEFGNSTELVVGVG
jgi:hypothetical protein